MLVRQRDEMVMQTFLDRDVPVVGVIGGGYDDDISVLAARHSILHQVASAQWDRFGLYR